MFIIFHGLISFQSLLAPTSTKTLDTARRRPDGRCFTGKGTLASIWKSISYGSYTYRYPSMHTSCRGTL
ncbi:hypothetical protein PM082_010346 [Marasmius tenuissimus]|nr:hypothetical protein PM082_010346 [Marasmius tenuissimus]